MTNVNTPETWCGGFGKRGDSASTWELFEHLYHRAYVRSTVSLELYIRRVGVRGQPVVFEANVVQKGVRTRLFTLSLRLIL